jgi:alkyldihydroxyacetonephosphate synthase
VNRVFDGLASGCLLVVGFEGESDVVEACLPAARAILHDAGGEDLGEGPGERWFRSRHAVSFKLMPVFERGGFADTMEVAAPWSRVEGLYEAVRAAVRPYALVMAHMSHAYPEGSCIYFSFAGKGDRDVYDKLWAAALEAVLSAGGTVSHHHGVGQLKARAASVELGAAVEGFRSLVAELDPEGVCNPGRVVVDVGDVEGPDPWPLEPSDGMLRVPVASSLEDRQALAEGQGVELMWPFEHTLGPERWARSRWQHPYTEMAATVDGRRCVLGRGPRSASGPDLRRWLAAREGAVAAVATVPVGERWCGRAKVEAPWVRALELLRAGLRPAVLDVDDDGALRVGFRGPAAAALGAVARTRLACELEEVPYEPRPLPAGPLVWCDPSDPRVVAVCEQGALRRDEETS